MPMFGWILQEQQKGRHGENGQGQRQALSLLTNYYRVADLPVTEAAPLIGQTCDFNIFYTAELEKDSPPCSVYFWHFCVGLFFFKRMFTLTLHVSCLWF